MTRFHHALGDFVSFMQWIRVQFSHQVIKQEKLELKQFNGKRPVKSPYMYKNKAIVFGKHTGVKSPKRSWDTFTIDKLEINFKDQGFSYNDLLCANHGAKFNHITGECIKGPCKNSFLKSFPFKIKNNYILAG